MSGWGWVMICSMLDTCCLLPTAFLLLLLLLSVGRWIPYFWLLLGTFGYGYGNSNSKILLFG